MDMFNCFCQANSTDPATALRGLSLRATAVN